MIDQPSRRVDQPEPCFVRLRLVKRGPYVAARISQPFGLWQVTVNGSPSTPSPCPVEAGVFDVWTSGEFISETEYHAMLRYAPRDPYQPIHASTRGLAQAMAEQQERDYWATRPI